MGELQGTTQHYEEVENYRMQRKPQARVETSPEILCKVDGTCSRRVGIQLARQAYTPESPT